MIAHISAPQEVAVVQAAPIRPAVNLTIHIVQPGDTLYGIAEQYYHDADWTRIWDANKAIVPNPDMIFPGQRLVIPDGPATGSPVSTGGSQGSTDAISATQAPQAVLQAVAAHFGWTGGEWSALQQLESMEDSGFNPTIANPSSGALGMAQALGHGTPGSGGSLGDEYGANYGLTTTEAQQANSGSAYWQAVWMCTYIQQTYGTPSAAVQFHLANNAY